MTKQLGIQFIGINGSEKMILQKFIEEGLIGKSVGVDPAWNPQNPSEQRKNVRIFLTTSNADLDLNSGEDSNSIQINIINISLGGARVQIAKNADVKLNQNVTLNLQFIDPPLLLHGVILEITP